ncbi:MAG: hypothetical protein ACNA7G_02165 [Methylobacter sp.]
MVESVDTGKARSEIAQSDAVMAQIINYKVENADYKTYGAQSSWLVKRNRYLFTLAFQDINNEPQTAELEWFYAYESRGLPIRRNTPWVGGLEALKHQPWINIYHDLHASTKVQLASPLSQRANMHFFDQNGNLQIYDLLLLSVIISFIVTLLYGLGHCAWSSITENDKL